MTDSINNRFNNPVVSHGWRYKNLRVWPENDLKPHSEDSVNCWCNPFWDEDVLVHNSADGRELYERGWKKPS